MPSDAERSAMSGLPDEAVEAMVEAALRASYEVSHGDAEGGRVGMRAALTAGLAALPAGVYVSDGQGKVEPGEPVAAYDGWAHVGCPDCGRVTTVPLDRMEPTPWCVHNGNISWRDPHPDTQNRKRPAPWTRTVPVIVAALSATDTEKADAP